MTVEFDLDVKYSEARQSMKWEQETQVDEDIKKSLAKYKEVGCPSGTTITDWLMWSTEMVLKDYIKRIKNGEDQEKIFLEMNDRNNVKFYY